MEEIINMLAFASLKGVSLPVKKILLEKYGTATEIIKHAKDESLDGDLNGTCLKALSSMDKAQFKKEAERTLSLGIEIVCLGHKKYPPLLKNIEDPPLFFYKKGMDIPEDKLFIAVVGSRSATKYGRDWAKIISRDLSRCGVTIVSGLASGVDTSAHLGCLEGGGYTVAVLGSGLLKPYPKSNEGLLKKISESGTVISEFGLDEGPRPENFPKRNRIISGLSHGVLVTEAALRSGARITARLALEQNREVFALPGRVDSKMSEGTNMLIREGLAKLVTNEVDILVEFEKYYGVYGIEPRRSQDSLDAEITEEERKLLSNMTKGESLDIDELAKRSSLSINRILDIILQLELKGAVARKPGNMIVREI